MTANALLLLKSHGMINKAVDAKFLGCHGADYVFGLRDHKIVAVDLVVKSIRIVEMI